nr:MAG TPA: hypothetical protein [Caudoviricetes sp.]
MSYPILKERQKLTTAILLLYKIMQYNFKIWMKKVSLPQAALLNLQARKFNR